MALNWVGTEHPYTLNFCLLSPVFSLQPKARGCKLKILVFKAIAGLAKWVVKGVLALQQLYRKSVMQDTSHNKHDDLYEQLMAISQQALISELYETAYHALTAALHYAQSLGEEQRLLAVEQAAKAQQEWIDTKTPRHRMATQEAVKRDRISLYHMLERQAATQALIIQRAHRKERTKGLAWPGDKFLTDNE